jgi:FkbM family methyltransferase
VLVTEHAARAARRLPPIRGKVNLGWHWMRLVERHGPLVGTWRIALGDMTFELPRGSSMTWTLAFGASWDAPFLRFLSPYHAPESLVLDIGASVGLWTVPLARDAQRRGSRVWAFEPMPNNVRWLQRNLELNDVTAVVDVHAQALGSTSGQVLMDTGDLAGGNAAVGLQREGGHTSVALSRLDDHSRPLPVSLMKLDVEGYELEVLRGARRLLEQDRPVVFGEFSRAWLAMRGEDLGGFLRGMTDMDYAVVALDGRRSRRWCAVDHVTPVPVDDGGGCFPENLLLVPAERALAGATSR